MRDAEQLQSRVEKLEAENEALNNQVKLLVQTEQRLYRTQNQVDAQLKRLKALSDFALRCSHLSAEEEIVAEALSLLRDLFDMDVVQLVRIREQQGTLRYFVFDETSETLWTDSGVFEPIDASETADKLADAQKVASLDTQNQTPRSLFAVRECLKKGQSDVEDLRAGDTCLLAPLRPSAEALYGYILLLKRAGAKRSFFKTSLSKDNAPFLQLLTSHLERTLRDNHTMGSLRARSHQLTENNEKLQKSLEQVGKLESLGRLAGGIAHDFNNLLTIILGNANLVRKELTDSPLIADIDQIVDASERASSLTSQLLAFGRKQERNLEVFDPNLVIRRLEKLLTRLLGRNISLRTDFGDFEHRIRADKSQLEQVIMNLVVNARDASEGQGEIEVRTRVVHSTDDGDQQPHIEISVRDYGQGMDEHTKKRIFEPFFTTKELGQGTGMGLATVYGIVKQSDGSIAVDSAVGEGACFRVRLPAIRPKNAGSTSDVPTGPLSRRRDTILLVDDEHGIRNLSQRILEEAGYRVLTAENGQDALNLAEGEYDSIDLLLTDVVMPRLGGVELTAELRHTRPSLRVLFITGYTGNALAEHGITGTSNERCLRKPFTPSALLEEVESLLTPLRSEATTQHDSRLPHLHR